MSFKTEAQKDADWLESFLNEAGGAGGKSKCLKTDSKCIAKEVAEKDRLKKLKEEKEKGIYKPPDEKVLKDSTERLVCNNDGFTKMIKEGTEVSLAAFAIVKETVVAMIPPNFKKALSFGWAGLVGVGDWMGFAMSGLFYIASDPAVDSGQVVCDMFGYGYFLIDELYVIVNFADKGDDTGVDISKLASQASKEAAAKAAFDIINKSKKSVKDGNLSIIQKLIDTGKVGTDAAKTEIDAAIVKTKELHDKSMLDAMHARKEAIKKAKEAKPAAKKDAAATTDAKK